MFKVLLLPFAVLAVIGQSGPVEKTPEESRADLLSAGLSPQAADGLLQIGVQAHSTFPRGDGSATPTPLQVFGAFGKMFQEMDSFMKTQSQQDKNAFKTMMEKMKKGWEAAGAAQH